MREQLPDDELKTLDRVAQWTIGYLLLLSLLSFCLGAWLNRSGAAELAAAAMYGMAGSAVAALTSCLDRYSMGFERENGTSFPAEVKPGTGTFNRRFARWLWVRPFLGAIIAPVFVLGIAHFAMNTQQWTGTPAFTAFMAGLLAKSVVDLIKKLFKNIFNV